MQPQGSNHSFWRTLPGILTGLAGLVTAIGGLLVVLFTVVIEDGNGDGTPTTTPFPLAMAPTILPAATLAAPPTAVPPTAAPPTAVPPTAVPPTAVPPTAAPPTAVPPTAVPPTAAPPTAVPPTAAPTTAASSIQVLYPNGGETLEREKPFTIRWTSEGISGNVKIILKGGTGSGGRFIVAESTPNTGIYEYSGVPANYGYSQFRILVMTLDESVTDESDQLFSVP